MKRIIFGLVALIMIMGLLLGGCFPSNSSNPTTDIPDTSDTPSLPTDNTPPDATPVFDNPPPDDITWISPGKVVIGNFYPGARAEYPITIHNGNNHSATFQVSYMFPNRVADGHSYPSPEVQDWVVIADSTPVLAPRETKDVLIVLEMPEDAVAFADGWEFWVVVVDMSQGEMVRTQLASRWLVSMRGN